MSIVLEVEQNGSLTLPAEALGYVQPNTRYVVETRGAELTLRPEPTIKGARGKRRKPEPSSREWDDELCALTEELSQLWPAGVSVTDVISEMRR